MPYVWQTEDEQRDDSMTSGSYIPARGAGPHATFRRLHRLPGRARAAAAVLLVCAAAPVAGLVVETFAGGAVGAAVSAHPYVVHAVALGVAGGALLALEPPRSASPLAYARQLHARFLELQSTFDADDRRRPGEGKEKEDDRVPSEP
jgi:hypothetical protein